MDDLREDFEIFLVECLHRKFLALESCEWWCMECTKWIEGRHVGDVTIRVAEDEAIEAWGSGYIGEESDEDFDG